MTKGQRSERQIKNSSRWTIYIIDSVNETKLSSTTGFLEAYPFFFSTAIQ